MPPARSKGFTDPAWQHCVAQDQTKKKVKCNYCGKVVSGGVYRLKQHLARISGQVTFCKKAPEEVYITMKEHLEGCRAGKKRQFEEEERSLDLYSYDENEENGDDKSLVASAPALRSVGLVDPGWEHGIAQDDTKKKVKCNYCHKVVSGGINRFKQHLARIPGEVAYCKMVPEEVFLKMKELLKHHRNVKKMHPGLKKLTNTNFYMQSGNNDKEEIVHGRRKSLKSFCNDDICSNKSRRKRNRRASPEKENGDMQLQLKNADLESLFTKMQKCDVQVSSKPPEKSDSENKNHKELISAICKFFYYAAIPFNAAQSPYFHKMLDLVGKYGEGLKGPSGRLIGGHHLQEEATNIRASLAEVKASWMVTGCSLVADSWKDFQGRTLINFVISCPRGAHFLSSVDISDIVEDATRLFSLLDKVVEGVGEENVVQVITHNTPSYKAAGKMLEEKRRNLFWTPCAAHSLEQLLEDFTKIKCVAECIAKSQRITKLIYNNAWLLNLLRKEFTMGKELLRPAATKLATGFFTLRTLLDHRSSLKRMFQSSKWVSSELAKNDEGREVAKIAVNAAFWKNVHYVIRGVDPVLDIFKKVENADVLAMPSMYNYIYQVKLVMKSSHGDDQKFNSFLSVVDGYWNSVFHHPLYVAAYFLNPSYRYSPDFVAPAEVIRGVNDCITRLESDNGRRVSATSQISDFVLCKGDFGTELALSTRTEVDPAAWWKQHGIGCLELQRIAIRILSQTCSSIFYEHTWDPFDHSYAKMENLLAQKRLNNLTFVHYNLRLQDRQLKCIDSDTIPLDSVVLEKVFSDWIVQNGKPLQKEDEEIIMNGMDLVGIYDNDANESEDFESGKRKYADHKIRPATVESLEGTPAILSTGPEDDHDADFVFIRDELTDK